MIDGFPVDITKKCWNGCHLVKKNTKSPESLPLWSRESSVIQLTMRFVRRNTTDLFPSSLSNKIMVTWGVIRSLDVGMFRVVSLKSWNKFSYFSLCSLISMGLKFMVRFSLVLPKLAWLLQRTELSHGLKTWRVWPFGISNTWVQVTWVWRNFQG